MNNFGLDLTPLLGQIFEFATQKSPKPSCDTVSSKNIESQSNMS
jgi:hypothetical protein